MLIRETSGKEWTVPCWLRPTPWALKLLLLILLTEWEKWAHSAQVCPWHPAGFLLIPSPLGARLLWCRQGTDPPLVLAQAEGLCFCGCSAPSIFMSWRHFEPHVRPQVHSLSPPPSPPFRPPSTHLPTEPLSSHSASVSILSFFRVWNLRDACFAFCFQVVTKWYWFFLQVCFCPTSAFPFPFLFLVR